MLPWPQKGTIKFSCKWVKQFNSQKTLCRFGKINNSIWCSESSEREVVEVQFAENCWTLWGRYCWSYIADIADLYSSDFSSRSSKPRIPSLFACQKREQVFYGTWGKNDESRKGWDFWYLDDEGKWFGSGKITFCWLLELSPFTQKSYVCKRQIMFSIQ